MEIFPYLCGEFQSENGRNCDIIRNTNTLWMLVRLRAMHLYSTPPCSTLSPKIKIFGDPLYADYRFFMLAWFIWDNVSGLYKKAGATARNDL